MILVGNQRGGARDMALHLLKDDNEHVLVHEVSGFASETVMGAFNEAYALSKGTRCKKFLFSLSVNPPSDKRVDTDSFISVIDRSEERLGLTGQPRVIVFHEKQGRRHAHCVWSRIDTDAMKAVHLPHTKKKLVSLTREIFIERGWKLPAGLIDSKNRDPRNFTLAEWQQAKRQGKDPRAIKTALQDAWAISDNKTALVHALQERGYKLAHGDTGRIVVIDHRLEVYALYKWAGQKTKTIKARIGDVKDLPSVDEAQDLIRLDIQNLTQRLRSDVEARSQAAQSRFEARRKALVKKQQAEREALKNAQDRQYIAANKVRQARFRTGLGGIWDHLRGEHKRIQKRNMGEAYIELQQNKKDMDDVITRHLKERQRIEMFKLRMSEKVRTIDRALEQDRRAYSNVPEP